MKSAISFVLLLAISLIYGQSDKICWDKDRKLNYTDFRGEIPLNTEFDAVCAAEILVVTNWKGKYPFFDVTNCFDPLTAWMKDSIEVEPLIKHEQLHFNIAELFARKIRKSTDSLREKKFKSIKLYSEIIQCQLKAREEMDELYDQETYHGLYLRKQDEWEIMISDKLTDYEEWSGE